MTSSTSVLPEVEEDVTPFDGMAHYARVREIISGGVVVALCGKKYRPTVTGAAVLDLPKCATCVELMDILHMMDPNAPKGDL